MAAIQPAHHAVQEVLKQYQADQATQAAAKAVVGKKRRLDFLVRQQAENAVEIAALKKELAPVEKPAETK